MINCGSCHQFYDALVYPACPFCNHLVSAQQSNNKPISFTSSSQLGSFEPTFSVVCPTCGEKNPRSRRHCLKCQKPLQTYSNTMEIQTYDAQFVQRLDERTRFYLEKVTLRAFVIRFLGMTISKHPCPKCQTICTLMDDDCPNPSCENPIYRYPCGTQGCGEMLRIDDKECPKCHQMTLSQFVEISIHGEAKGEMTTNILKTAEKITGFKIFKPTLPSDIPANFILQAKNVLETIANEKAKILEIFSQALRDLSVSSQPVELGNTANEIYKNFNPMLNIQNPQPTNNIVDVIQRRSTVNPTAAVRNTANTTQGNMTSPPNATANTTTYKPNIPKKTSSPAGGNDHPWDDEFEDHEIV